MMMAKVEVKGLKSVFNAIKSIFDDSIKKKEFLTEIKDFSVLRIQAETRKGKDLTKDGAPQKALTDGYVRWRKKLATGDTRTQIYPDTDFFRPSKSNLTLTGQLLKSLQGRVNALRSEIEIQTSENRNDGEKNKDIVKDLSRRGRTFLGMDEKGKKMIRKQVLDEIRRQIRGRGFTK
jgi:hypothetical protein